MKSQGRLDGRAPPCLQMLLSLGMFGALAAVSAAEPAPVVVERFDIRPIGSVITALGVLEDSPQILYFETSGNLEHLLVGEGDRVERGQLLAQLDRRQIDYRLERTRLTAAHSKRRLERSRLLRSANALAADSLDDNELAYASQVLEVSEIEEEQSRHDLLAPVAARILRRFLDFPGPVDQTTPIFIIKPADRPWRVTAFLTGSEVTAVSDGDRATMRFDGLSEQSFPGEVVAIADHANERDGMVEVDIALDDLDAGLRIGMNARVVIEVDSAGGGYVVPVKALSQIGGGKATLFAVGADGVAHERRVEFQLHTASKAIVHGALEDFMGVVIHGQHNLSDGVPVQIAE